MRTRFFWLVASLVLVSLLFSPFSVIAQGPQEQGTPPPPPFDLPETGIPERTPPPEPRRPVESLHAPKLTQADYLAQHPDASLETSLDLATDGFGYSTSSYPYSWVSTDGGSEILATGDYLEYTLPFTFMYYETGYSTLYIDRKGFVTFDEWIASWQYYDPYDFQNVPTESLSTVIAPLWGEFLDGPSGAQNRVYLKTGGSAPNRYVVIEWRQMISKNMPSQSDFPAKFTFELVLYENGDFLYQYGVSEIDWYYCGDYASGFQDLYGFNGLDFLGSCSLPGSFYGIYIDRPTESYRVQLTNEKMGALVNQSLDYTGLQTSIYNNGTLGNDSYEISITSSIQVMVYQGGDWLSDTDLDGKINTKPVCQGCWSTIWIGAFPPSILNPYDTFPIDLRIESVGNPSKTDSLHIDLTVPPPFVEVLRNHNLNWEDAVRVRLAGAEGFYPIWMGDDYSISSPSIAMLPDGGYVVVTPAYQWDDGSNDAVGNLYITLLDSNLGVTRNTTPLTTYPLAAIQNSNYSPAVAVAPSGNIGIAWLQEQYNSTNGSRVINVFYAVLSPTGQVLVAPTNLTNNTAFYTYSDARRISLYSPGIAATADNRFTIVWAKDGPYTNTSGYLGDVYYAVRSQTGASVKAVTKLTNDSAGDDSTYANPSVIALSNGSVLVSLRYGDWDNAGIYTYRLNSGGTVQQSMQGVSGTFSNGPDNPLAVELSSGCVAVAWQQMWDANEGIYARILNPDGSIKTSTIYLPHPGTWNNSSNSYYWRTLSLVALPEARFALAWNDATDYNQMEHLSLAVVDDNGAQVLPPVISDSGSGVELGVYGYALAARKLPTTTGGQDAYVQADRVIATHAGTFPLDIHLGNLGDTTITGFTLTLAPEPGLFYAIDNSWGVDPTIGAGGELIWEIEPALLKPLGGSDLRVWMTIAPALPGTSRTVEISLTPNLTDVNPANNTITTTVMFPYDHFLPSLLR